MTDGIAAVAIGAALLQVLAYGLYLRNAISQRIEPNPTSWLMWAYGTALIVMVESDQGIAPLLRILPMACAACCVLIALLCWKHRALAWPADRSDRAALGIDLLLTAVYLALSAATVLGWLPEVHERSGKTIVLVCISASTIVSYLPMLRSTRRNPDGEKWLPWSVWTAAYTPVHCHGGNRRHIAGGAPVLGLSRHLRRAERTGRLVRVATAARVFLRASALDSGTPRTAHRFCAGRAAACTPAAARAAQAPAGPARLG